MMPQSLVVFICLQGVVGMWERVLPALGGVILGYVFGAIPTGYLVGKAWGIDVRHFGSGRTGGSNVFRSLGWGAGALTGLGDVLKGVLAVLIVRWLVGDELAASLAGAAAVCGHNWPAVLSFRGGAGGATAGAVLCTLSPIVGAIVVPLAIFVLFVIRYASLATLTAVVGAVIGLTIRWLVTGDPNGYVYVFGFALPTLVAVLVSLRPNIIRLLRGHEKRINFDFKRLLPHKRVDAG